MTRETASNYWESEPKRPGIFINYRYTDIMAAVALDESLTPHYGDEAIFRADRSLLPDDPYGDIIPTAVARASLMLVIIGSDWAQSLVEGRHSWALLEMQWAEEGTVPFLPVFLTRVHNEHDDNMRWSPVERPLESVTSKELPPIIPSSLLAGMQSTFGTMQPRTDAERIREKIEEIIPALGSKMTARPL